MSLQPHQTIPNEDHPIFDLPATEDSTGDGDASMESGQDSHPVNPPNDEPSDDDDLTEGDASLSSESMPDYMIKADALIDNAAGNPTESDLESDSNSYASIASKDSDWMDTELVYADPKHIDLPPPNQPVHRNFGIAYTADEKVELELLKLLDDNNCPHTMYHDVMSWVKNSRRAGYTFHPNKTTRSAVIAQFKSRTNTEWCMPCQTTVALPKGPAGPMNDFVPVTTFEFRAMVESLLNDPLLTGNLDNLDVDKANPFGPYKTSNTRLSTSNSGKWYLKAYKNLCTEPQDMLLPIILACDETTIAKGKKHTSWPINFTFSIFSQELRAHDFAWRPLGYIYDLSIGETKSTDYKKNKNNPLGTTEVKHARLQAIIKHVLQGVVTFQREGGLKDLPMTLGGVSKVVDAKTPVMKIIGDIQGGDKICGCFASYSNGMTRPCRKCNVKGEQLGDPDVICRGISQQRVEQWMADEKHEHLAKMCQYTTRPAFFDVDFGGCKFGVFAVSMCAETLHILEQGLMKDSLRCLYEQDLNSSWAQQQMDRLVRMIAHLPRQRNFSAGTDADMPRLRWKDGISVLTDLTSSQIVGVLFTLVILSLTSDGREHLGKAMVPKKQKSRRVNRLRNMQYMFQMQLCFWQWLKKDSYWEREDHSAKERARDAIRVLIGSLPKFWPRLKGQGWDKPKTHELLHIPDDIERHGAPSNTNSHRTENHHISGVKRPFERTQKRRDKMDYQIALRRHEDMIIQRAWAAMNWEETSDLLADGSQIKANDIMSSQLGGSLVRIELDYDPYKGTWDWSRQGSTESAHLNDSTIDDAVELFLDTLGKIPIDHSIVLLFHTECRRGDRLFRAHELYCSESSWFDWVMIRWEGDDPKVAQPRRFQEEADPCEPEYDDRIMNESTDKYCYAPGRLCCFLSNITDGMGGDNEDNEVLMLVETCDYKYTQSSVFTTRWEIAQHQGKNQIHLLGADAICDHCLMIPESLSDFQENIVFHQVWAQERWADQFHED